MRLNWEILGLAGCLVVFELRFFFFLRTEELFDPGVGLVALSGVRRDRSVGGAIELERVQGVRVPAL